MNKLQLFLPCAAGVEDYLLPEVQRITGRGAADVIKQRGGVALLMVMMSIALFNDVTRLFG